jgi:predicted O-methyltransferase YrrM
MPQEPWVAVAGYLDRLFPPDAVLTQAVESSAAAGLPAIAISHAEGRFLHLLARHQRARAILEIGTLGGYSAIWLARALPVDGRLVTLELDPRHAEVARANLARAGMSERVKIRVGPALETLPDLAREYPAGFDLIFIDADKGSYPAYWSWALKLSHSGTLIVADNVVRSGAVVDSHSTDADVQAVRRYLDLVAAEPGVLATVMQTVGPKGYDGMSLALVL